MIIFNSIISNFYTGVLTLTKVQYSDISAQKLAEHIDYVRRGFLWHPNFVGMRLLGESRIARIKVEIKKDDIPSGARSVERSFSFPMTLENDDKLHIANYHESYLLDVSPGAYYVRVAVRSLTHEEVENDANLMEIYKDNVPVFPGARPCNFRISFCIVTDNGVPRLYQRDREITRFGNELYILNSNYEPVLFEDGSRSSSNPPVQISFTS